MAEERRGFDVVATAAVFLGLLAAGALLVTPAFAPVVAMTPPILFAPVSDIAGLRGISLGTGNAIETIVGLELSLLLLFAGAALSEGVYSRYGVRLNGLIAAPLLALFFLIDHTVLPLYVGGVAIVFAVVQFLNRRTLLYGRVLLSTAIISGVALSVPVGAVGVGVEGSLLLFTAILAGIGAYNLHRVATPERPLSITLSSALFTGSATVAGVASGEISLGSLSPRGGAAVFGGVLVCVVAAYYIAVLEGQSNRIRRQFTDRTGVTE